MAEGRLAESIVDRRASDDEGDTEHGTSTEYIDPWCDLCYDEMSELVKPCAFCPECNTFICKSCYGVHRRWPVLRDHKILLEGKMPKSQADKPVKYLVCETHVGNMKEHFCLDHQIMVCIDCTKQAHKQCSSVALSNICQDLGSDDIHQFIAVVDCLKQDILSIKSALLSNASNIKAQKEHLIKQAEKEKENIISKAEDLFIHTVSMITEVCEQKCSRIADHILTLDNIIWSDDEIICDINKKLKVKLNPNVFIQMQHIVEKLKERNLEVDDIKKQLHAISLSFSTTAEVSTFLSHCKYLGDVKELPIPFEKRQTLQRAVFPQTEVLQKTKERLKNDRDISKISARKMKSFNIRINQDKETCRTGQMDVKSDGVLILADYNNSSVKSFSTDNQLIGTLPLARKPEAIKLINDTKAVVATTDKTLQVLDIFDIGSTPVKSHLILNGNIGAIAMYKDYLVVTCWDEPKSVKLIDINGKEIWSVTTDSSGQSLFKKPSSVTVSTSNDATKIIVTDWEKQTLTVLDPTNGDVIEIKDVKDKHPFGINTDDKGNVYICYDSRKEIGVWSPDLQETRILLSGDELQNQPIDIAYCSKLCTLYISYIDNDIVDCFNLSYG